MIVIKFCLNMIVDLHVECSVIASTVVHLHSPFSYQANKLISILNIW